MKQTQMTYISLFSSAGVGCYGFKQAGFECVATNELIERRLQVQKFNGKCKYESGYICGDIADEATKEKLFAQIDLWRQKEKLTRVDVILATPPCQGMSVANHKKTSTEIIRNSLVTESIKIIKRIRPKFFVFENVPSFMKTVCTDLDGTDKTIAEAIRVNLGQDYSYYAKVINLKHYGACSSRQRTLVIGVANDWADEISPIELYPSIQPEKTLREVIGSLKPLTEFGEIDPSDIYHSFRTYPEQMRRWISDLSEGQSAFENDDDSRKPHQVIDGKIIINVQKNGDKYRRQFWDRVGPCIHTRNDQLASQNTIHPADDRVFSIRELMMMMTVPAAFRWAAQGEADLNRLSTAQKKAFLKKEEMKIRQSLGEAVPTCIFREIAENIKKALGYTRVKTADIRRMVEQNCLDDHTNLIAFLKTNPHHLSPSSLSRIAELSNTLRTDHAAFFTSKTLITEMIKNLPDTEKNEISILEPSVGVGNFVPLLIKRFEQKAVSFDLIDVDEKSLAVLRVLLDTSGVPQNCKINLIHADFLLYHFDKQYDYVIGNPPFYKLGAKDSRLPAYRGNAMNRETSNICSFFLDRALQVGRYVAMVFPKFLLNTPEFRESRAYLSKKPVDCIIDFGEKGFPGVLVETIAIFVAGGGVPLHTRVISVTHGFDLLQKQRYIFDSALPYWIIYRNDQFDRVCGKLHLDVFEVFRDRQITNRILRDSGEVRVLKSRNLDDQGTEIRSIDGYDSYANLKDVQSLSVIEFLHANEVYLTPNMTYKPRVILKPDNVLVNGSVAILIPKDGIVPTQKQLRYFSSEEYREFYQIARNYQTRSLNVDACSVYFYGLLKE